MTFTTVSAQEVKIDARQTEVDVDRQGVRVDTDRTPRDVADRRVRDGQGMNRQITQWLLVDQHSMVNLAQFGLQRTKTPATRIERFAATQHAMPTDCVVRSKIWLTDSKTEPRDWPTALSGYEFDASLLGMFVASHLQQEATLEVLSEMATGDLKNTIDDALATVRGHRGHAERVMEQIKQ